MAEAKKQKKHSLHLSDEQSKMQPQCIELFVFCIPHYIYALYIYRKSQHNKAVASAIFFVDIIYGHIGKNKLNNARLVGNIHEHTSMDGQIVQKTDLHQQNTRKLSAEWTVDSGEYKKQEQEPSTQKTKIQADKLKLSAACANNRPSPSPSARPALDPMASTRPFAPFS